MLSISEASLLFAGIVVILVTPGPTNTLLAAGLRRGVKRAMPLMFGEFAGYLIAISVWSYVLSHAANVLAWLPGFMRIACSLYIAYLAVRMWRAAVQLPLVSDTGVGVRTLFVTTLLNPKAMLFAGTIFPAAAFARGPLFLQSMSIFTAALVPIALLWIAFGAALGTGRPAGRVSARVRRGASLVLDTFSMVLAWSVFR